MKKVKMKTEEESWRNRVDKILLSIIIPHYNTPELLVRLIQSIPKRRDIQILVVDDNSTVELTPFVKFMKKEADYNIELMYNTSGIKGAGSCRNIGVSKMEGDWVLFADADDFFVEGFFQKLEPYFDSQYDEVFFKPTSLDERTGSVSARHVLYSEMIDRYLAKTSLKNQTEMKYGFCTPWSKLIRASIIEENGLQFDQVMVSNDIMFMTKCAYYSRNITATKDIIYCVTRRGETLTAGKNGKHFDIRMQVFINRHNYLKEHLSKKEFNYVHLERIALGKLVDVVLDRYGFSKFMQVLKIYHENGVKFFKVSLLNPLSLFHNIKIKLLWWWDIEKNRNNR